MRQLLGNLQVGMVVLVSAALCAPALAHFIGNDETAERQRLTRFSPSQVQQVAPPIFEFSPFRASEGGKAPAMSDPLGFNSEPSLALYSGVIQNSDLLENFRVQKNDLHLDVELPAGVVRQGTLVRNYVTRFFDGETRAADRSLTRLKNAGYRTWLGLPTTRETSPLTLAGFGSVTEFMKPRTVVWLECDGVNRRIADMEKKPIIRDPKKRKKPKLPPQYCYDI